MGRHRKSPRPPIPPARFNTSDYQPQKCIYTHQVPRQSPPIQGNWTTAPMSLPVAPPSQQTIIYQHAPPAGYSHNQPGHVTLVPVYDPPQQHPPLPPNAVYIQNPIHQQPRMMPMPQYPMLQNNIPVPYAANGVYPVMAPGPAVRYIPSSTTQPYHNEHIQQAIPSTSFKEAPIDLSIKHTQPDHSLVSIDLSMSPSSHVVEQASKPTTNNFVNPVHKQVPHTTRFATPVQKQVPHTTSFATPVQKQVTHTTSFVTPDQKQLTNSTSFATSVQKQVTNTKSFLPVGPKQGKRTSVYTKPPQVRRPYVKKHVNPPRLRLHPRLTHMLHNNKSQEAASHSPLTINLTLSPSQESDDIKTNDNPTTTETQNGCTSWTSSNGSERLPKTRPSQKDNLVSRIRQIKELPRPGSADSTSLHSDYKGEYEIPGEHEEWWSNGRKVVTDQELIKLPITHLKVRLNGMSPADIMRLKHRRRTLKNRNYARDCRKRRMQTVQTSEEKLTELQHHIDKLETSLRRVREERDIFQRCYEEMKATHVALFTGDNDTMMTFGNLNVGRPERSMEYS